MVREAILSAYAGESMAQSRYRAFSEVADKEGFKNVARLFEAIAYAEQVHARNHLKVLKNEFKDYKACGGAPIGLGKTSENLDLAINGEEFEVNEMYPAYLLLAQALGDKQAEHTFKWALEAEKTHAKIYREAKKFVDEGKDFPIDGYIWVCPVCGYTYVGKEPPDKCPLCGLAGNKFSRF